MKIQSSLVRRVATGVAVKVGVSRQVAIPKKFFNRLGLTPGDYLEISIKEERLVLTPKTLVERRLVEGLADIKAGRTYGPFSSVKEMLRSLQKTLPSKRVQRLKTP